jgi:predicted DNA-binding protein (MmcQ/YjbR family)
MSLRRQKPPAAKGAEKQLRDFALQYPDTAEEFPWGERVIKVNKKIFLTFGRPDGTLSMSMKLPNSGMAALTLPFAEPTGYGLGKSGWVTARFKSDQQPPVELLCRWIDESYRAVAPKKLIERLIATGKPPR